MGQRWATFLNNHRAELWACERWSTLLTGFDLARSEPEPVDSVDATRGLPLRGGSVVGLESLPQRSDRGASADDDITGMTGMTGGTTDTTGSATDSATTGVQDDCAAMCEVMQMCAVESRDYLEACEQDLEIMDNLGSCAEPFSALIQCVGGLDCEQYDAYQQQDGEYPCREEYETLNDIGPRSCALEHPPSW